MSDNVQIFVESRPAFRDGHSFGDHSWVRVSTPDGEHTYSGNVPLSVKFLDVIRGSVPLKFYKNSPLDAGPIVSREITPRDQESALRAAQNIDVAFGRLRRKARGWGYAPFADAESVAERRGNCNTVTNTLLSSAGLKVPRAIRERTPGMTTQIPLEKSAFLRGFEKTAAPGWVFPVAGGALGAGAGALADRKKPLRGALIGGALGAGLGGAAAYSKHQDAEVERQFQEGIDRFKRHLGERGESIDDFVERTLREGGHNKQGSAVLRGFNKMAFDPMTVGLASLGGLAAHLIAAPEFEGHIVRSLHAGAQKAQGISTRKIISNSLRETGREALHGPVQFALTPLKALAGDVVGRGGGAVLAGLHKSLSGRKGRIARFGASVVDSVAQRTPLMQTTYGGYRMAARPEAAAAIPHIKRLVERAGPLGGPTPEAIDVAGKRVHELLDYAEKAKPEIEALGKALDPSGTIQSPSDMQRSLRKLRMNVEGMKNFHRNLLIASGASGAIGGAAAFAGATSVARHYANLQGRQAGGQNAAQ